ncbi:MAG TPA: threonine/serine exporter family protein [Pseudonocardiaceae bacterium]|nr:threonine/serine exporter family protein [Pseudonocardiaceae bacterium]
MRFDRVDRKARRLWVGATSTRPPFAPVDRPIGPELPDDATVNLVLDLALRLGEVLMASGAGASDVTATVIAVTSAYGLPHCEVDVIFTSISICCQRGSELAPVTTHRVVRSRAMDYTRLSEVERLVRDIGAHRVTAAEATEQLRDITGSPHPYPRWLATLAWALMAAAVAVLIGGGLTVGLVAAGTTALIDRIGRLLNRRGLPFFFQQVVGGVVATLVTLAVMRLGVLPPGVAPSLVVAAAITVLLSGLSLVGAVQDAISGFNLTAAGRTMETTMMSAGLVAGVVVGLGVAVRLGLPSTPVADVLPQTALRLPVQVVAGAAAAAAFALASYATRRALPVAAGAGALGAGAHAALDLVGVNQIAASALAAVLIGFCGGTVSRRFRLPPLVIAVSGLTPLLPGLTTYRSMYELAVTRSAAGLPTLMVAVASALALAAGVVLGEFLAQPVRTGLGRLERRLAGPRMAGPLRPSRRRLD